jgi:hypothetical protein
MQIMSKMFYSTVRMVGSSHAGIRVNLQEFQRFVGTSTEEQIRRFLDGSAQLHKT